MAKATDKKADKKAAKSTPSKKAAPSPAKAVAKTPLSSKEIIAKAKEQVCYIVSIIATSLSSSLTG